MTRPLRIDFISDVVCPWCVIGLGGLEAALERLGGEVEAQIHFQPFELNPDMPAGGQNIVEHIGQKYGSTPEQSARAREAIRERAAQVGFNMAMTSDSRIYNTFDAHRLLHWAGLQGRQAELKRALFAAYFTRGEDLSEIETLAGAAQAAGLDAAAAREVIASGRYGDEVRRVEAAWREAGVSAVPTVVVDERYVISGGQPAEVFERALRTILAETGRTPAA
jgi:predicted DsbA family dithiol-disulfide isomerase